MDGRSHNDMQSWWAARQEGLPERAIISEEAARRKIW